MKTLFAMLSAAVLSLFLVACGGEEPKKETAQPAAIMEQGKGETGTTEMKEVKPAEQPMQGEENKPAQ